MGLQAMRFAMLSTGLSITKDGDVTYEMPTDTPSQHLPPCGTSDNYSTRTAVSEKPLSPRTDTRGPNSLVPKAHGRADFSSTVASTSDSAEILPTPPVTHENISRHTGSWQACKHSDNVAWFSHPELPTFYARCRNDPSGRKIGPGFCNQQALPRADLIFRAIAANVEVDFYVSAVILLLSGPHATAGGHNFLKASLQTRIPANCVRNDLPFVIIRQDAVTVYSVLRLYYEGKFTPVFYSDLHFAATVRLLSSMGASDIILRRLLPTWEAMVRNDLYKSLSLSAEWPTHSFWEIAATLYVEHQDKILPSRIDLTDKARIMLQEYKRKFWPRRLVVLLLAELNKRDVVLGLRLDWLAADTMRSWCWTRCRRCRRHPKAVYLAKGTYTDVAFWWQDVIGSLIKAYLTGLPTAATFDKFYATTFLDIAKDLAPLVCTMCRRNMANDLWAFGAHFKREVRAAFGHPRQISLPYASPARMPSRA
ncbi:hypothetical protein PHLGIDRAFT_255881 [Phlebiopsis gigantea 11061_1 CR5-6]|uniref:Uncharacterized protein n=1 Tax=Phlebiopsis gigantea (strain 11061_1 CR5-6) TaxID=745531 RepID=A0A0C3RS44_PHLG1|nr:hypothetical protein PHLGIDRAFT_255881 [Phlebiopsis gigantea 11061_1 CR5-6]